MEYVVTWSKSLFSLMNTITQANSFEMWLEIFNKQCSMSNPTKPLTCTRISVHRVNTDTIAVAYTVRSANVKMQLPSALRDNNLEAIPTSWIEATELEVHVHSKLTRRPLSALHVVK